VERFVVRFHQGVLCNFVAIAVLNLMKKILILEILKIGFNLTAKPVFMKDRKKDGVRERETL